ncbi:hypothetical protein IGI04_024086 [Brassica rapa subsp. trilocularis]|uniref:Uncharacterized protein n=1 Tax=Brassica rapa subsp. trilocularis TaxID=1813537 RepID=A0ABQ7M7T8_BRACM|nr:hypothetical protein IGI04_024086 [Brassica rapa subsp. trilocularis]
MNGLNKVTRRGENKVTRTLGSREFMRYYKQKPPPSSQKHIVNSLATRFVSCDKGDSLIWQIGKQWRNLQNDGECLTVKLSGLTSNGKCSIAQ